MVQFTGGTRTFQQWTCLDFMLTNWIVMSWCRYTFYNYIYIYAFSRRFYPKQLTVHSGYTCFCQYMCSLGIEPTTFALLTQCSTTEPQLFSKHVSMLLFVHTLFYGLIYFTTYFILQYHQIKLVCNEIYVKNLGADLQSSTGIRTDLRYNVLKTLYIWAFFYYFKHPSILKVE